MTTVRPATPEDVDEIIEFIHALATFEKEPDAVKNTAEILRAQLFCEAPAVFAYVAEADGSGTDTPAIDFYRAMGAEEMTEWLSYRLTGDALTAFAAGEKRAGSALMSGGLWLSATTEGGVFHVKHPARCRGRRQ